MATARMSLPPTDTDPPLPALTRLRRLYRHVGVFLLNTLLIGSCIELVAWGESLLTDWRGHLMESLLRLPPPPLSLKKTGYYATVPWAQAYWDEHARSEVLRYRPYVGWRHAPYTGRYITVDAQGQRWTPDSDCTDLPPTSHTRPLFFVGSSDIWGAGAPGDQTIPSYVQRQLQAEGFTTCVRNLAEFAYVSRQGVLALQEALLAGQIPAVAVLYMLHDDIFVARYYGQPGLTAWTRRMTEMFTPQPPPSAWQTVLRLLTLTHAYDFVRRLLAKVTDPVVRPDERPLAQQRQDPKAQATLAQAIVERYLANIAFVRALSVQYGFTILVVIPPHLFLAPEPLTLDEARLRTRAETDDPGLAELTRLVMAQLAQAWRETPALAPLMPMVHHEGGPEALTWLDAAHTTPVGNARIAERLVEELRPLLQEPRPTGLAAGAAAR